MVVVLVLARAVRDGIGPLVVAHLRSAIMQLQSSGQSPGHLHRPEGISGPMPEEQRLRVAVGQDRHRGQQGL